MAARKVLMVDDEADFLNLMVTRIHGWGYELIKAVDGKTKKIPCCYPGCQGVSLK